MTIKKSDAFGKYKGKLQELYNKYCPKKCLICLSDKPYNLYSEWVPSFKNPKSTQHFKRKLLVLSGDISATPIALHAHHHQQQLKIIIMIIIIIIIIIIMQPPPQSRWSSAYIHPRDQCDSSLLEHPSNASVAPVAELGSENCQGGPFNKTSKLQQKLAWFQNTYVS